MLRYMMTTFEATVPLGHRGRGTEESIENNDRQALVVHAVYKSRMTGLSMQESSGASPRA